MSDKVLYPSLLAIPRPKLGDPMYRLTLVNQYEEAIVVSILSPNETSPMWSATLMTKNGIEFVSGDVEHRTVYNWMPKGWVYDKEKAGWTPPQDLLRKGDAEVVIEDPEEAMHVAATSVYALPEPWEGEKFMSWRSRAMKSVPRLKERGDSSKVLSQAWKDKAYQVSL
jgi:hypothetical protein